MSTINQQPLANPISLADQIALWSSSNGDTRRTSITQLLALLQAGIVFPAATSNSPTFLPFVGGVNDIIASAAVGITVPAYFVGQSFLLFAANSNNGAMTINVAGLGVKALRMGNIACVGGESVTGNPLLAMYDGVQFQILATGAIALLTAAQTLTNKTLGAGSVLVGPLTVSLAGSADGDVYYRTGNVLTRLPIGAAGNPLRVNAGGTAPAWSLTENPRAIAYRWTDWNSADLVGTATNAPATTLSSVTAADYISMANASGTLTLTFAKAGNYEVEINVANALGNTPVRGTDRVIIYLGLGGTATRHVTVNTNYTPLITDLQIPAVNASLGGTLSFMVTATAGQTLTILPTSRTYITTGGANVGQFANSCEVVAAYQGT